MSSNAQRMVRLLCWLSLKFCAQHYIRVCNSKVHVMPDIAKLYGCQLVCKPLWVQQHRMILIEMGIPSMFVSCLQAWHKRLCPGAYITSVCLPGWSASNR